MASAICQVCSNQFTAMRSTAKFCSDKCRVAASRIKAGQDEILGPIETPRKELVREVLTPSGPTIIEYAPGEMPTYMPAANNPTTPAQTARVTKAQELAKKLGFELIRGSDLPKTEFIPTGHLELDAIIKGFPRKRITEIYGPASVGKTTLMLQTIAQMDPKLKVLYVDMENAITPEWMESIMVGLSDRIDLANPMFLEDAATYVLESMDSYDLIVFDSVASALIKPEEAAEVGNAVVGVKPRIMTSFMRRLVGPLARTRCAVVFINQEKPTIGDMYAPKWYTPGGIALDYAASLRLRLTSNKADRITREGSKVGKKVKAEITKNKVGTPDREAQFLITY